MEPGIFVRISPSTNSSLALAVEGDSNVVLQSHVSDSSVQIWKLQPVEGLAGNFIVHHTTNKALSWLELGSQLLVAPAGEGVATEQQVWNLVSENENNNSVKRISSGKDSSISLETTGLNVHSPVLTSSWQGMLTQQWVVTDLPPTSVYPAPSASHAEVLADRDLFSSTLAAFHSHFGSTLKVPSMGGRELDLHLLYSAVTARCGLAQVIQQRTWKDVVHIFSFPPTITNASYVLRKFYFNLLFHYEQVYFFGVKGFLVPPPSGLPPPVPTDPDSKVVQPFGGSAYGPRRRKKRPLESSVPQEGDPSHLVGQMVSGTIYGKFDYGFLVTVEVGAEKLTGVLYHTPKGGRPHPFAIMDRGASAGAGGSEGKKKKRRKSSAQRKDPSAPKAHRSAYNFFFQEWRKRLKEENPELNDRECTSKIGERWSALSEEGRQHYKDMSVADKVRHTRELADYNHRGEGVVEGIPEVAATMPATADNPSAWGNVEPSHFTEGHVPEEWSAEPQVGALHVKADAEGQLVTEDERAML